MNRQAAEANWKVLSSYNGDFKKALEAQHRSQLGYGSEFRSPSILEPLFHNHCLWPNMKQILTKGAIFPLDPIDETTRKIDLTEALQMGNHKGAIKQPQVLENLMADDVQRGFSLPIPVERVIELDHAVMAPQNVARQNSIDETGKIIEKDRLTHDQSWVYSSGAPSMNDRVREVELTPVQFGRTSLRMIHYIVATRRRHPNTKLFMNKFDFKSAYRREHVLNWSMAIQTITQMITAAVAFINLRLTFGGKACPSVWCDLAEPTTDLANDLLSCSSWNPSEIHSPLQEKIPPPKSLPDSIPFGPGLEMIVDIPAEDQGKCDIYLDDGVTVVPELGDNLQRASAAFPLAVHLMGRPRTGNEPIPRAELLALKKLAAEGGLAEQQIFLGWLFDLRRLMVSLPDHKFKAWFASIDAILQRMYTDHAEMETLIGRLEHMCTMNQMARHFMSRLRFLMNRCLKQRRTKLQPAEAEDLRLMQAFLTKAHQGISMNLLTFRRPNIVLRLDASTSHGLGGYSADGRIWRWAIPTPWLGLLNINILEFLAVIIGIWIEVHEGRLTPLSCILAMTDNTSAAGWVRKSNFSELRDGSEESKLDMKLKRILARKLASITLDADSCLYSQWFPGNKNDVADCCSRRFDLPDSVFIPHLKSNFADQLPTDLDLRPIPEPIISWVTSAVQRVHEMKPSPNPPPKTNDEPGDVGANSSSTSNSSATTSSKGSASRNDPSSSALSPKRSAKPTLATIVSRDWLKAQSEQPSTMWLRPSRTFLRETPEKTRPDKHRDFYLGNTEAIATRIQRLSNKKRSRSVSFAKSGETAHRSKTLRPDNSPRAPSISR